MRSRHLGLFGVSIASCLATAFLGACEPAPPAKPKPVDAPQVEKPPATPPPEIATPPIKQVAVAAPPVAPAEAAAGGEVAPPAGPKPPRPPVPAELAPSESLRLGDPAAATKLRGKIDSYFDGHVGRRIHIQTDKPLYKPGETIWVKVWDLTAKAFAGAPKSNGMYVELISPRGASILKKKVHEQTGLSQVDFPLAPGTQGGEYNLRVRTLDGQKSERPIVISSYEAPRIKFKLEFVRKAYGAGDEVNATIEVKRPTGEPLANHALVAAVRLDGQDLPRVPLTTDAQGEGLVRFTLPPEIALGDGLLTVLCDEGGLTESVARRVPIVLKKLSFAAYPEGGELVIGLPGRVYFEAKNPLGKPADISGHISDENGTVAARFSSVRDGLGRIDFSPEPGKNYHVEIDKPVGITDHYPLPPATPEGCVLRSFDDLDGQLGATRVSVRCTQPRNVHLTAMLRENLLDAATVEVPVGAPAIVYLSPRGAGSEPASALQGVTRVTLYDDAMRPLAERLIYRQRRARLGIKVTSDKKTYVPRDRVQLDLQTTDAKGNPVPADLTLGVIDDTVLAFADDKTGHMLSRLYLEPELPGKIEEPNFYFCGAV